MRGVTMNYPGGHLALDNVSLDIEKGEFVFLVGPSGSGKSTLVRLLLKELEPSTGKIFVAGRDIGRLSRSKIPYLRRNIGCVFQDFKLLPNKTVYENVSFALEVIGKPRYMTKNQVEDVLKLVGLGNKMERYPNEISGGEMQRVSIARAFVNHPPILLADEPTGNLDPVTTMGLMKLFNRINRLGTTVVVATHDKEMVDSMRKRVVALEAGRIVRDQARGVYGH
ncbi:MAG: cell division ATP-binding protein FtsE [Actinomycetota bacterium]